MTVEHVHRYVPGRPFASMLGGYGVRFDCECGAHLTADGIPPGRLADATPHVPDPELRARMFLDYARKACFQAFRYSVIHDVSPEAARRYKEAVNWRSRQAAT